MFFFLSRDIDVILSWCNLISLNIHASNEKLEIQSPIFDNLVISFKKKLEIIRIIIFLFYSL